MLLNLAQSHPGNGWILRLPYACQYLCKMQERFLTQTSVRESTASWIIQRRLGRIAVESLITNSGDSHLLEARIGDGCFNNAIVDGGNHD